MFKRIGKEIKSEVIIKPKFVAEADKYKPVYANETDYCMDLKIKIDGEMIQLEPNECKTVGTGLKVAVPEGWGLFIDPRSSTGFKLNCMLANTLGIIDSGYRDEIKVCLYNFGHNPVTLYDGQRLCQIFILPRYKIIPEYTVDNEEFRNGDRGGGIGSSGRF